MNLKYKIYDNIFDQKFLIELNEICDQLPNKPNNIANRTSWPYGETGTHNLMGSTLYTRFSKNRIWSICPMQILEMFDHIIQNVIKQDLLLISVASNMQVMGMDGSSHVDDDSTILVMCNKHWKKEWGGDFELLDVNNNILKKIDYIPGRIVYFEGSQLHRGLAPTVPYVYRHSLVFRVKNNGETKW